jgi:hypothetical protein
MARLFVKPSRGTGDSGQSVVAALTVVVIVFLLGAAWLSTADHQTGASRYDRDRQRAIDAANAGLAAAQVRLAAGSVGSLLGVDTGDADYDAVITTPAAESAVITAWGYSPSKAAANRVVRTMQQSVDLVPAAGTSFHFAIQSDSTVNLDNGNRTTHGNVYAGGVLNLNAGNQTIDGNLNAGGNVNFNNGNQTINGNLYAGGTVTFNNGNETVNGNVYAQGDVIFQKSSDTVNGDVQARGDVQYCTIQNVTKACLQHYPDTPTVSTATVPTFTWNPADYPATTTWTGNDTFRAWAAGQTAGINGAHHVQGTMMFGPSDTLSVNGDLTVYVDGFDAKLPKAIVNKAGHDVNVRIIVRGHLYPSNGNFDSPASVKLLVYSTQPLETTQPCTMWGSVVSPGSITGGANCELTYVTVDDTGFNFPAGTGTTSAASYTVRSVSINEINPPPAP